MSETIFHYNTPTLSQTSGLCTVGVTQVKADGLVQVSDLYCLPLKQGMPPANEYFPFPGGKLLWPGVRSAYCSCYSMLVSEEHG